MKTTLKISALLNLFFFVTIIFLAVERPKTNTDAPLAVEPVTSVSATPPPVETKPFHWSQLESTNYLTYVQNLRGIGCPEATVRDIVVADVEQLYQKRAQQLQQGRSASSEELQRLSEEKVSVITYLLGLSSTPTMLVKAAPTPEVLMPLVWQKVDPTKLNLEPGQLEALAELRQNFLDQLGGPNQDTNSPAYLERWHAAQANIDEALAGTLGTKAFLELESLATR